MSKQRLSESIVIDMVQDCRKQLPRLGGKKVYSMIKSELDQLPVSIGRDKLFRILKKNDLLIKPKKSFTRTTNSSHRFRTYNNLIRHAKPTRKNQIWVSDITYIRTIQGFCYLALITDAYSRKIVGYDISNSLELVGCIRALKKATRNHKAFGNKLIHHSDRGIQYCSNQYTKLLRKRKILVSMAAKGNCYENALAERVNGILKGEFNLDISFKSKQDACKSVKQAIFAYNEIRPHYSIGLMTPNKKHAA
jgi:putative transposase